jgi:transposase-like protein
MTKNGIGPRARGMGKHWTDAVARGVLDACARSGLSMRAFAEREGLEPRRLYRWHKRLEDLTVGRPRPRKPRTTASPTFAPIVLKQRQCDVSTCAVVIRHGASTRMEVDDASGVSPSWVAAVMIELERAACS